MTKRTLGLWITMGLVVLAGGGLVARRKMQLRNLEAPGAEAQPVRTVRIQDGSVARGLETVALIQSDLAATVSAQASGTILEARVREGDRVQKGQLLALIDARTLEDASQTAQARAQAAQQDLAKQQAIFDRDKVLFDGGAVSKQALEISAAQLEAVRATQVAADRATQSARTTLGYTRVVAPFAGLVRSRMVEVGDLATPGKPLFAIQGQGPVNLLSKISQEDLLRLQVGGEALFSSGADTLQARITRIYPAMDASRLGSVETVLKESPFGLMPGATVHARYQASPVKGLVVPTGALLQGLSETLLIRVRAGKADPVAVTVLSRGEQQATITGPVAAGDEVVVALPSELMALTKGMPLHSVEGVQ
jgi:RND family efflux transporter MFP subunit